MYIKVAAPILSLEYCAEYANMHEKNVGCWMFSRGDNSSGKHVSCPSVVYYCKKVYVSESA